MRLRIRCRHLVFSNYDYDIIGIIGRRTAQRLRAERRLQLRRLRVPELVGGTIRGLGIKLRSDLHFLSIREKGAVLTKDFLGEDEIVQSAEYLKEG